MNYTERNSSLSPSSLSPSPLSVKGTTPLFSRMETSPITNQTGQCLVLSFHSEQIYERRAHLTPCPAVSSAGFCSGLIFSSQVDAFTGSWHFGKWSLNCFSCQSSRAFGHKQHGIRSRFVGCTVAHAYNPDTEKGEAGGLLQAGGQSGPHRQVMLLEL